MRIRMLKQMTGTLLISGKTYKIHFIKCSFSSAPTYDFSCSTVQKQKKSQFTLENGTNIPVPIYR